MSRYNPYKLFVGSFIPNWLLEREEISSNAKLVFARLAQYAGESGEAFPLQKTLCREVGLPDSTTRRALNELVLAKLVESQQNGLGRPNSYFFLKHEWMVSTVQSDRSGLLMGEQTGLPMGKRPVRSQVSKAHKGEENQGRDNSLFDEFWKAYPNKKARGSAIKAWTKHILSQPSLSNLFQTVMQAVENQKRSAGWLKENGAFIPHPATWLNGERWLDVVEVETKTVATRKVEPPVAKAA